MNQFVFCSREWLLLYQCLNEVLHGFLLSNLETVIGIDEPKLAELLVYLGSLPEKAEIPLDRIQTLAFRNALRETLRELGVEEFHTRTGYDFDEGNAILAKLDVFVGKPGK
jgi:hypothetical protein